MDKMITLKLVIVGSRSITNKVYLYMALIAAIGNGVLTAADQVEIISGGAKGVDSLAKEYAIDKDYIYREFLPDYKKYQGKVAPLIRNKEMADYGDVLIAVWDGVSTGTQHIVKYMRQLGKPVFVYDISKK